MDPNPVNAPLAAAPEPGPADPALEAAVRELHSDPGAALRAWLPAVPSFFVGLTGLVLVTKGIVSGRQMVLAAAVLLVHKAGWALAMRASGSRERGSLLVPFFGTVVGASQTHPWKQAAAALAGPVPGVLFAAAVFLSPLRNVPVLRETAWVAVVAGALDLLPFGFLGGGRLLHAVVCRRHAVLEAALAAMPSLAYLGLALATGRWVPGAVAVGFAVPVLFTFRCARAAARLSGRIRSGAVAELSRQGLELLYSATFEIVRPRRRTQRPPQVEARVRASWMRQLHRRTLPQAPLLVTVALVAAWLLASGIAWATIVAGVRSGVSAKPRIAALGGTMTPAFRWVDGTRAEVRIRRYTERTTGGGRKSTDSWVATAFTATRRADGGWSLAFDRSEERAPPGAPLPDLEKTIARHGHGEIMLSSTGGLVAVRLSPRAEAAVDGELASAAEGGLEQIVARGRALEATARAPMIELWELLVGIVPRETLEAGVERVDPASLENELTGEPVVASVVCRLEGRVECGTGGPHDCVLLSYTRLEDASIPREVRLHLIREGGMRVLEDGERASLSRGFVVLEEATLFPRAGYVDRWTRSRRDGKLTETREQVRIEVEPVR